MEKTNYIIQGHKRTDYVIDRLVEDYGGILNNPEWKDCTDPQWHYFINGDGIIDRVSDMDNETVYEKSSYDKIKNNFTILGCCTPRNSYDLDLYERPLEQFQKMVNKLLNRDTWNCNFYDVLDACPKELKGSVINTFKSDDITYMTEISDWLKEYQKSHHGQRLSIYPIIVRNKKGSCGSIFLCNGLNGPTIVSIHSLPHVMDIIKHIEETYHARAYISSCNNHSDVYYYGINFVIWGKEREPSPYVPIPDENGNWSCDY